MQRIVIWGLRSDFHSHKFIQQGFFSNAKKMGFEAIWIDDKKSNASLIRKGDIVFAVDVASDELPLVKGAKYVLHNILPSEIGLESGFISIDLLLRGYKCLSRRKHTKRQLLIR